MKTASRSKYRLWLVGILLLSFAFPAMARVWQFANGDTLEGDLLSYKSGTVILAKEGGGKVLFAIDKFSAPDQALIRQTYPDGDRKAPKRDTPVPPTPVSVKQPEQEHSTEPILRPLPDNYDPDAQLARPANFSIGMPAPADTGGSLRDGTVVTLEQLRGKMVLIEFVGTSSEYYQDEIGPLTEIYRRAKPLGFEIITIFGDRSRSGAIKFRDEHHMDWPIVIDSYHRIKGKWGFDMRVTRVLVDQNGIIVADQVSTRNLPAYLGKYLQLK